ncbi:hypothetical protein EDC04DRAFT_2731050 [Pisolithus marmoratus]|nr:hypothetical protein EDC04DRAFT_2731050 [Pisolithus marmoratus]
MSQILTLSIRLAKMKLVKTLALLAFAAYSRAQCAACPSTVDGEDFVSSCVSDVGSFTYCSYAWTDACLYTSDGYVLILESTGNCPTYVGTTTDCTPC